ncbi:MAG: TraX family protein [Faecalibacterium sp.]|nr:TraX family protein [Faecalibacterium sp.]
MTALSPRRTFSGTALKTIACITMLVDHIGASCIEAGILTPGLDAGTLSQDALSTYPLYRLDMVLRFTGRLAFPLFCFLLVEGFVHTHNVKGYLGRLVLFGLLSEVPFDLAFFRTPFDFSAQNVYWTLALAANTDYNASGVIIICALYLTRTNRKWQCLAGALLFMFELTAPLAFVLIWFYNGQRGACSPLQKKAFYWFYPVHLLVLAGITNLLL